MSKITLLKPFDEAEALALERLLYDNDISSEVISYRDTAYDGLFQTQKGWGVLNVEEKDFSKAKEIISKWKESSPQELDWQNTEYKYQNSETVYIANQNCIPPQSNKLLFGLLLTASLILNIWLISNYASEYSEELDLHPKQFDTNGNLVAKYDYIEGSQFPYKTTTYIKNGKRSAIFYDQNSNAWQEKIEQITPGASWVTIDKNENGIFEISTGINKNGLTIIDNDLNEDTIVEEVLIKNKKGELLAKYLDRDLDHIFEEIIVFKTKNGPTTFNVNLNQ